MKKERRKGFLCGFVVAAGAATVLAGCQVWVIRNVPYTYRTSGWKVLVGYVTNHTDWYDF